MSTFGDIDDSGGPTRSDVVQALIDSGVDVTSWGVGEAKTLDHLLTELREGDCELFVDAVGLARRVRNVWVDVVASTEDGDLHLVERQQVFLDGRSRTRDLPASLGEKCKLGEDPEAAARRGVAEELGISSEFELLLDDPRENPIGKPSFPGLRTVYETHWFVAKLHPAAFNAKGYVETQPDKRTYFEWES